MFIRVKTLDNEIILVNPDCPVGLIYDYLRKKANIQEDDEFDLSDDSGTMKNIASFPPTTRGLELFTNHSTYDLVLLSQDHETQESCEIETPK